MGKNNSDKPSNFVPRTDRPFGNATGTSSDYVSELPPEMMTDPKWRRAVLAVAGAPPRRPCPSTVDDKPISTDDIMSGISHRRQKVDAQLTRSNANRQDMYGELALQKMHLDFNRDQRFSEARTFMNRS